MAQNKQQKVSSKQLEEPTSEELPTLAKEKTASKASKAEKRNLKTKKEAIIENDERTLSTTVNEIILKSKPSEVDKENRAQVKVEDNKVISKKPVPRRAQFKRRPIKGEEEVVGSFLENGLDKEDVLMMKLAFVRLKGLDDEMVEGMHWAYYPHNILLCVCVYM